jgi:hypothetical protein
MGAKAVENDTLQKRTYKTKAGENNNTVDVLNFITSLGKAK